MGQEITINASQAALDYILNRANYIILCNTEPTNYSEALSYKIAEIAFSRGSDCEIYDGYGGLEVTVYSKYNVPVTSSGKCKWICLIDTAGEELLVRTYTEQVDLVAAGIANIDEWYFCYNYEG